MTRIDFEDGKYSILHYHGVGLRALRYGEPWRDCSGDGLILALVQEVEDLREQQAVLVEALTEYMAAYNEHWERGMPILEPMGDAALAAVKFVG